jgi:hypothetical protein
MKNLKFVDFCKGIMFLLIGIGIASFGIASISNNSAKADSPNTVNNSGKIQMSTAGFVLNNNPVYNVLVWDTETGKSKLYNFDRGTNKLVAPSYQLPSSPLY